MFLHILELMEDRLTEVVRQVDEFLVRESNVHQTLERITRRLADLEIDFAIAGGLAVGSRGHLRTTVDVNILITEQGLQRFRERCLGRGYLQKFAGSKGVRDVETGVPIDFLVAGEYPGDGLPKLVSFPDPSSVPSGQEPYRVLDLRTLIELKLASGLSAPDRLIDLADVLALIRANRLGQDFAGALDASVREKYEELWRAAKRPAEY